MNIIVLEPKVSKTAVFDGTQLDISGGLSGFWSVKLKIHSLTAGKKINYSLRDTVDNFTASVVKAARSFVGAFPPEGEVVTLLNWSDHPSLRQGVTSAELQLSITEIDADTTCVYEAWVENGA
jgi:hypothetical protein